MTKSYADACLARANAATDGPWSTLDKEHEVHAISFVDAGGDPLHVAQWIAQIENSQFIAHARQDVPELARRLKKALVYLRDAINLSPREMKALAEELEAMPDETKA